MADHWVVSPGLEVSEADLKIIRLQSADGECIWPAFEFEGRPGKMPESDHVHRWRWRIQQSHQDGDFPLFECFCGCQAICSPKKLREWQWLVRHPQGELPAVQPVVGTNLIETANQLRATLTSLYRAMPYEDYLRTDHWRQFRDGALSRAQRTCQLCNSKEHTLHVHHRTYDRLGHELPEDVTVFCEPCHKKFHGKEA